MADRDLERRLDEALARLARIERHLNLPEHPPEIPSPPESRTPASPPARVDASIPAPPSAPPTAPTSASGVPPRSVPAHGDVQRRLAASKRPSFSERLANVDVEQFIGRRLVAWVGGLIVIVAAVFFVKLAYDRGWIGAIPPSLRAIAAALFGLALIAAGELTARKLGRAAAIGLFIAGLGTLYVDAFSSFRLLDLYGSSMALALLEVVAVVGLIVTIRSRSIAVGVLSLLGGFAAPLLISGFRLEGAEIGLYLASLLAIAFGAASFRPRPFAPLRGVALGLLLVPGFIWSVVNLPTAAGLVLLLLAIWWGIVHAQAVYEAILGRTAKANAILAFIATCLFGFIAPVAVRAANATDADRLVPLGLAVLSLAAAFQFGTGVAALRKPMATGLRERALSIMTITLWLEAGVLLVLAAALFLTGQSIAVAWLALGAAGLGLARRLESRGVLVYGLVVALLGTLVGFGLITEEIGRGSGRGFADDTMWAFHVRPSGWIPAASCAVLLFIGATGAREGAGGAPPRDLGRGWPILGMIIWTIGAAMQMFMASLVVVLMLPLLAIGLIGVGKRSPKWMAMSCHLVAIPAAAVAFGLIVAFQLNLRPAPWDGLVIGAAICALLSFIVCALIRTRESAAPRAAALARMTPAAVSFVPAIACGIELGRWLMDRDEPWALVAAIMAVETAFAALFGLVLVLARHVWSWWTGAGAGAVLIGVAAAMWLVQSIFMRFADPAMFDTAFGVVAGAGVVLFVAALAALRAPAGVALAASQWLQVVLVLIPLWLGSLLLDDLLGGEPTVRNGAISVWWGLYAIGMIVAGFQFARAPLRHAGLALLGATAFKFLGVDLGPAGTMWRVVFSAVTGLLMVGTSMLYFRLSPRTTSTGNERTDDG